MKIRMDVLADLVRFTQALPDETTLPETNQDPERF